MLPHEHRHRVGHVRYAEVGRQLLGADEAGRWDDAVDVSRAEPSVDDRLHGCVEDEIAHMTIGAPHVVGLAYADEGGGP
jgi:hypothetical protein